MLDILQNTKLHGIALPFPRQIDKEIKKLILLIFLRIQHLCLATRPAVFARITRSIVSHAERRLLNDQWTTLLTQCWVDVGTESYVG